MYPVVGFQHFWEASRGQATDCGSAARRVDDSVQEDGKWRSRSREARRRNGYGYRERSKSRSGKRDDERRGTEGRSEEGHRGRQDADS